MTTFSPTAKSPEHYTYRALFRDIWPYCRNYRFRIFVAFFLRMSAEGLWTVYLPWSIAELVRILSKSTGVESVRPVLMILISWFLVICYREAGNFFARNIGFRITERVALDMEFAAIKHSLLLDMAWHERENSGTRLKRIQIGGRAVQRFLQINFTSFAPFVIQLLGVLLVMSISDGMMGVFLAVFMCTYVFLSRHFAKETVRTTVLVQEQDELMHGLLAQMMLNVRTVKALHLGTPLGVRLSAGAENLYGRIGKRVRAFQLKNLTLASFANLVRLGLTGFIVWNIFQGRHDIAFLVLFNVYFVRLAGTLEDFMNTSQEADIARQSIFRMMGILGEPVTIEDETGKQAFPNDWNAISMKELSFAYEENARPVLKKINLTIRRGEKIGIVGLSGAGKSTLFKLLLKENESFTGELLIGDMSIRDIAKRDYASHVTAVLQDTEVFNFTLKENIIIAAEARADDPEALMQAIRIAHLDKVIQKLPNGVDTLIGEKGVKLSGGERQRLGIARAIFRKPDILLLDEATSHLDIESEQEIRAALHEVFKDITAVVVAHRLTTIREMDRIVVIEHGAIIEEGTFEALQAKGGRFAQLWEKQHIDE